MKTIDLRSDTVTRPTPAMREAMASAELGDDVYGEDPTVNRLEAAAAARVGKEAAVFVPSGTMANQIAIRLHTHHAEVVLASQGAHVLRYEGGAASALAGVQIATIGEAGLFDADAVRAAYVPASNVHLAPTTLLVAEDTHNVAGGRVFPLDLLHGAVEAAAAARVGKEAAVFVPSGTMANQIAINVHTTPGTEVLCVDWAHVRNYEVGAASALSGVAFRNIPTTCGVMTVDQIRGALVEAGYHLPAVSLLVWENTHNLSGGSVVPLRVVAAGSAAARESGLAVHMDGARLWNAVTASGTPAAEFAAQVDSLMFCFSKALGAPVGSVVCGSADFIDEAHGRRKRFGGGMRQAGVIAAAALVGLRDRERLHLDHEVAQRLGRELSKRYPDAASVGDSNMVLLDEVGLPFRLASFVAGLDAAGVRVGLIKPGVLRFVTHRDVDDADVDRVLAVADALTPPS